MHVVVLALALLLQVTIDRWDLTSYGSAHCVLNANHNVCEVFDSAGGSFGHPIDNWYPWFCQVVGVEGGNAYGVPLRVYLAPPNGYGVSCYAANNYSGYYGWTTNTGAYEGQQITGWPAWTERWYVPGRDPASPSAYGTVIKV